MVKPTAGEVPVSAAAGGHVGPTPPTVAISGDEIVGRALALLLQNFPYDARFLPVSVLGESEQLDNVHLLLLTPMQMLSRTRRETLLTMLRNSVLAANMPILVLSNISGETQELDWIAPECVLRWPCSTQELERRIEKLIERATADPKR